MRIKYLFELGGENNELAKTEALEMLKTEMYEPELVFSEEQIAIIEVSKKLTRTTIRRLGMTRQVSRILISSKSKNIENLIEKLPEIDIGNNSFAIRQVCKSGISERKIAIKIGEKISIKNRIDLANPDVKILFYNGSRKIISILEKNSDTSYKRCLQHHVKYRPYFSPISIHPRIARAMINLGNCLEGETALDPFCGTGGILIEAADMGIKVKGIDILEKMVENSEGNLKHFGLEGKITQGDVEEIQNQNFEAIVTDPPYGISSTTKNENLDKLFERTMKIFDGNLEKGKRIVMAVSNPGLIKTKEFRILYHFEWYIHKSLTRHIMILEKTSNSHQ